MKPELSTASAERLPALPSIGISSAHPAVEARSEVPADDTNAKFRRLRALRAACSGADSYSQIAILISAMIDEGFNTRPQIIGVCRKLGYDTSRVAKILDERVRSDWRLGRDGRYSSIPPANQALPSKALPVSDLF